MARSRFRSRPGTMHRLNDLNAKDFREGSVSIETEFTPGKANIVENIYKMRRQVLLNIAEAGELTAAMMQEDAQQNALAGGEDNPDAADMPHGQWRRQDRETIHNPDHGYNYGHADEQIEGTSVANIENDTVLIALAHSDYTVQERKGGPIYYGVILEARTGLLQATMEKYYTVFERMLKGSAMAHIDYKGAGKAVRGRSVRVNR